MKRILSIVILFSLFAMLFYAVPGRGEVPQPQTGYLKNSLNRVEKNGGLSFDGSSSYVTVENSPSLEPQNLTVIGLLNPKSLNNVDIICKDDGYNKGWRIIWDALGNQKFLTEINFGDNGPTARYTNKSYDLGVHMAAFTYDHANIKNYVDGKQDGVLAENRDINYTNSTNLVIGARDNAPDFPLNGNIYSVLLYNTSKSDNFIKGVYNHYFNNTPLPAGFYDNLTLFYEPSSIYNNTLIVDHSPQHNNGTIYGATPIPPAVENLTIVGKNNGNLLSWNATKWASYYNIYRSTDMENWTLIGSTQNTEFFDNSTFPTRASNSDTYYYYVTAVDQNGNSTAESTKSTRTVYVTYSSGAAGFPSFNTFGIPDPPNLILLILIAVTAFFVTLYLLNKKRW